jgi:N-methylhydantoinase B
VLIESPGGGGWGDPLARDTALVAAEVADGLLSPARARAEYGVALDPTGAVDTAATEALRGR